MRYGKSLTAAAFIATAIGAVVVDRHVTSNAQAQPTPGLAGRVTALEQKVAQMAQFKLQSVSRSQCLTWTDANKEPVSLSCDHSDQVWRMVPSN